MVLRIQSEVVSGVAGEPIRVVPTGAALGATVKGVDLKDLHDAMFARIMQAWHDYSVLLFRHQTVTDQELMAFSRRLGDFDWAPIQETGRRFVEGLPEIFIVSNVKVNGEPIGGLGDGESVWHTDMSYLDVPPKASILYSLEVPVTGGNTSFCTMYGLCEALPARLKDRIAGLKISTTALTPAAAMCDRASRRPMIRAPRRALCTHWRAPIRRAATACSISVAGAMPTSPGLS